MGDFWKKGPTVETVGYVVGNARRTRFKKISLMCRTPSGPTVETVGYVMGNARRTRFKKISLISRPPPAPRLKPWAM